MRIPVASDRGHAGPLKQTGTGGPSQVQGSGGDAEPDLERWEAPSQPLRVPSRKWSQSSAIPGGRSDWPHRVTCPSLASRGPWVGRAPLHLSSQKVRCYIPSVEYQREPPPPTTKSRKELGYPAAQIPTNGYNHGSFWRGLRRKAIIMECRPHPGVREEPGTKETNWKAAGIPQGGVGAMGLERKRQMWRHLWGLTYQRPRESSLNAERYPDSQGLSAQLSEL